MSVKLWNSRREKWATYGGSADAHTRIDENMIVEALEQFTTNKRGRQLCHHLHSSQAISMGPN